MICPICDSRLQYNEKLIISDTDIYGMFKVSHVEFRELTFGGQVRITAAIPIDSCPGSPQEFNKCSIGMLDE